MCHPDVTETAGRFALFLPAQPLSPETTHTHTHTYMYIFFIFFYIFLPARPRDIAAAATVPPPGAPRANARALVAREPGRPGQRHAKCGPTPGYRGDARGLPDLPPISPAGRRPASSISDSGCPPGSWASLPVRRRLLLAAVLQTGRGASQRDRRGVRNGLGGTARPRSIGHVEPRPWVITERAVKEEKVLEVDYLRRFRRFLPKK